MITEISKDYVKDLIENNSRPDNRKFDEFRDIKIDVGVVKNAEGSAEVQLGNTRVIVGVKMELGEPFPDSPKQGALMVNTELNPIGSPDFEPGRPGKDAIEISRVVDRVIRESEALNMEDLCIEEGKKVWIVCIDIDILDDDGNLIDASLLGAVAALRNTKIPKIEGETINHEEFERDLKLNGIPIACTVIKIGNNFILDPCLEESSIMDARLTVGFIGDSPCAIQKGGSGWFTKEEIKKAMELIQKKVKMLEKKIKESKKENKGK